MNRKKETEENKSEKVLICQIESRGKLELRTQKALFVLSVPDSLGGEL